MKKNIFYFVAFLFAVTMAFTNANAQNVNVNPGAGTYPTLKAAFDAINAGTHTGSVTVDIVGNTTETAIAILNASGTGSASYTSVVIAPSGGARTITGSDTVTIKLAGADNVTIDGRIAGTGRNLSVLNTSILTNATAIWVAHGGFAVTDSAGAKNNTIRNCEVACGVSQNTATTTTFGINFGGTTKGNVSGRNNDSNRIIDNRIIKCRIGININGGSATNLNDDNSVSGNTVGPTAFGSDQIGGTGIFVQFQNRCIIEKNLVQFVGGNFANTTAGADRVGIGLGQNSWTSTSTTTTTGSNNTVQQNVIHDIIEERTFSALGIVAGTTLSGPKTNNLIANNVIYNVRANSTPGDQCIGIGHTGGPGDRIVFNSISLTGDLDPAAAASASTNPVCAGISKHLAAAADTAVFISDNSILVDVNTNTTTLLKAAIIGPAVGYAFGSGGLNNNDYWLPNFLNGNVTGVTGTGTTPTYTNLANWQAAYTPAQDGASIQADPLYSSNTSNLQPGLGSPLVGAGAPVAGITTDILGVTRSVTTPTIGAYETAADVSGPSISYALLGNTTSTANRSLGPVTITDPSGVNGISGTSPRVYYKKSTDPNTLAGWKYTEATGSSPFNFTIDYSLLSGGSVTAGDNIQYFVVAQDLQATPVVGINSGTFNAQPSSVALTASAFPMSGTMNNYIIVGPPLAGDYTVGVLAFNRFTGKNITFERVVKKVMREVTESAEFDNVTKSETPAVSSLSTLNGRKVTKEVEEVTFVPMENGKVYEGPLYAKRDENPNLPSDAGAGVYATITAAVNDLNARGSSAAVRFLLLDATYPSESYPININFTTSSAVNTLTIQPNAGVTTTISGASVGGPLFKILVSYVTLQGSNTGGSTRDMTIENTSATTPMAIWIGSTGTIPLTNTAVKNCIVRNGVNTSSAIVLTDKDVTTTGGYFNNITIENNSIERAYIGIYSFAVAAAGNGTGYNVVSNSLTTSGANSIRFCGIYVQGFDGANVSQNEMANYSNTEGEDDRGIWFATGTINSTAQRNSVHNLEYLGTGGYGGNAIVVSSGTTGCNNIVKNNMIYKISGDGWNYTTIPTDNPIGISIFSTQSGVGVYYNSISMTGNTLNQTSALSMGIYVGAGTVADIRDNSIQNDLGLLAATGYGTACVYAVTNSAQFAQINYNNYYCNATGSGLKLVGQIAAVTYANLAAWQGGTAQDANSISADPLYISSTDLHLTSGSPNLSAATPISGITNDYDGNLRNPTTPDIGADEFGSDLTLKLNWEACPNPSAVTVEIRNATTPYAVVETVAGTAGGNVNSVLSFSNAVNGTSYYIVVKSANSVETWTAAPVLFNSNAANYNFTTALSQAYGSNQRLSGGIPSIYQGDANQDGFVDGTDVILTYNDAAAFTTGPTTDFNCDGTTDLTDVILAFNNAANFIQKQRP